MVRAAALSAALFLAGAAIPVAGTIAMLLAPAPILIFAVARLNANLRALSAAALAGGLVAVAAGPVAGLAYGATIGLATLAMCVMIEAQLSLELIVLVTAATMLTAGIGCALLLAGSPDILLATIHEGLKVQMQRGQEFYKTLGIEAAVPPDTQASIIDLTIRLSPA